MRAVRLANPKSVTISARAASGYPGVDLWRSFQPAYGENGTRGELDYNTYKFTHEALQVIGAHPASLPLFIYLCFQNV